MISDKEIPTADPGALIIQYTPLLYRIVKRYKSALDGRPAIDAEDLLQAGRMAIFDGQKQYDPEGDSSFLLFIYDRIRLAMRHVLGFKYDGSLPEIPIYLDTPVGENSEETRLDFVPDPSMNAEESIIEQDTHQETAEAVHAAIDRLKNAKQREVITRCWIDGQDKTEAAAEMGINIRALQAVDLEGRHKLRRDCELRSYAAMRFPSFRVGVRGFRSTWTSATEKAVLWRENLFDEKYGTGAFVSLSSRPAAAAQDPDDVQTSMMEART